MPRELGNTFSPRQRGKRQRVPSNVARSRGGSSFLQGATTENVGGEETNNRGGAGCFDIAAKMVDVQNGAGPMVFWSQPKLYCTFFRSCVSFFMAEARGI